MGKEKEYESKKKNSCMNFTHWTQNHFPGFPQFLFQLAFILVGGMKPYKDGDWLGSPVRRG